MSNPAPPPIYSVDSSSLMDWQGRYGDYVEQLTFLLFLKMADEQAKPPFSKPSPIPKGFGWDALLKLGAVVSANLRRAIRLRQSILHKAFTGQLV